MQLKETTYQNQNDIPQKFQTRNMKFWLIALFILFLSMIWVVSIKLFICNDIKIIDRLTFFLFF
jgi:hypothetical protein